MQFFVVLGRRSGVNCVGTFPIRLPDDVVLLVNLSEIPISLTAAEIPVSTKGKTVLLPIPPLSLTYLLLGRHIS